MWIDQLMVMDDFAGGLAGANGKSHTYEENRCYVLAIIAYLRRRLDEEYISIS